MTEPMAGMMPANRSRGWAWAALVLSLFGALVAVVLVREHIAVTGGALAEGLFCGGGGRFDCGQVAAHDSSWLLGLPVALWGLIFYITVASLALGTLFLGGGQRAATASLGAVLCGAALVFDAYLAWTMFAQIGAVCLNCVATYGVNLLLALCCWRLARSESAPDYLALVREWRPLMPKLAIALFAIGGIGAAVYFTARPLAELRQFARDETLEFLAKLDGPPEIDMSRFAGLPARGPENAPITIVVAGDFQCNYCRALSGHVEQLREEHPDRIRVMFLNAPVNSACNPAVKEEVHEDACWLAEIGVAAAAQGRFWQYHDALFHTLPQPQVTREVVGARLAAIGLDTTQVAVRLADGTARGQLGREIELAIELKLVMVPSMVINGHARRSGVYPAMLRDAVRAMLARL